MNEHFRHKAATEHVDSIDLLLLSNEIPLPFNVIVKEYGQTFQSDFKSPMNPVATVKPYGTFLEWRLHMDYLWNEDYPIESYISKANAEAQLLLCTGQTRFLSIILKTRGLEWLDHDSWADYDVARIRILNPSLTKLPFMKHIKTPEAVKFCMVAEMFGYIKGQARIISSHQAEYS